ncbi:MAG TPA: lactate utilization protein [Candidatus Marinimicrobia bacterium]|nr:lactate utilization protein [Candidatus Neomarinimicrobiota bacterium]
MSQLKAKIHETLKNESLQKNYYQATHSAVAKNRIRAQEPERWESLRQDAYQIRKKTIENLPIFLEKAEASLNARNIETHWAINAEEARQICYKLLQERGIRQVVKAKSMLTEELELNDFLEKVGIRALETDLGEFIIQEAGEKPSHITAPAIHKSASDIAHLFEEKFGLPYTEDERVLTEFARQKLRDDFLQTEAGISGANFLVTEDAALCLVENEGNIRLSVSIPPLHIAFVGIEKVVPDYASLAILLELLAPSATGQDFPGYFSMIRNVEPNKEIHVVFVDNGRSDLWQNQDFRELLHCIRCGACLNSCPVYQHVGGHSYGWTYPGPIGALLTPLMRNKPGDELLPFMSTLCGACTNACPVKIPLHHLLLKMRHQTKSRQAKPPLFSAGIKAFTKTMLHPRFYSAVSRMARILLKLIPGENLPIPCMNKLRHFARPAKKMYRDLK